MNQRYWAAVALVLTVGCSAARPAVVRTSPAGDGAMTCAAGVLAERGYEVREGAEPELTLEGEVRFDHSPLGAIREIITTSVDRVSTPPKLTVIAGAWEYRSAEHSLAVARQSVTEVRPSDEVVADARMILETCGLTAPTLGDPLAAVMREDPLDFIGIEHGTGHPGRGPQRWGGGSGG